MKLKVKYGGFNPLSTNPAGNFFYWVTTRQILTRFNISGCNPLGWIWVEFKKSKISKYGSFINLNSTGLKKLGFNPFIQPDLGYLGQPELGCNPNFSNGLNKKWVTTRLNFGFQIDPYKGIFYCLNSTHFQPN
jgi:hypothetical protein